MRREIRLSASHFIDCTGTAILGILAGAPTMFGIESADEFGESHAPAERLDQHHGHTVFFRTRMADEPVLKMVSGQTLSNVSLGIAIPCIVDGQVTAVTVLAG